MSHWGCTTTEALKSALKSRSDPQTTSDSARFDNGSIAHAGHGLVPRLAVSSVVCEVQQHAFCLPPWCCAVPGMPADESQRSHPGSNASSTREASKNTLGRWSGFIGGHLGHVPLTFIELGVRALSRPASKTRDSNTEFTSEMQHSADGGAGRGIRARLPTAMWAVSAAPFYHIGRRCLSAHSCLSRSSSAERRLGQRQPRC